MLELLAVEVFSELVVLKCEWCLSGFIGKQYVLFKLKNEFNDNN